MRLAKYLRTRSNHRGSEFARTCFHSLACTAALGVAAVTASAEDGADQSVPQPTGNGIVVESGAAHWVASIELGAPRLRNFVLRATVPVPPGTFPRADGLMPLSVEDIDGTLVPTQIDSVSWYPGHPLDADVVEVIAVVRRPIGAQQGDRITYRVFEAPHNPGAQVFSNQVQGLANANGSILIRSRDVFGHVYTAKLNRSSVGGTRTTKDGPILKEDVYHDIMRSQSPNMGPPNGALDRFFGVHSYLSRMSGEECIMLDLRVHNGTSGLDPQDPIDDPQDRLYFDAVEILLPPAWKILHQISDPQIGAPYSDGPWTVYPIVAARTDGKMHVMPIQGQFHRRLAIVKNGTEFRANSLLRRENMGFCTRGTNDQGQELWSWWNDATANYFPQKHRLPTMSHKGPFSMRHKLRTDLQAAESVMISGQATGTYPFFSNRLGFAHPWGVKHGGMASGTEIFLYDGIVTAASASQEGYLLAELTHRMYTDRHPAALFNKNGLPTRFQQWIRTNGQGEQYLPFTFYQAVTSNNDPMGFDQVQSYQVNFVENAGLTPGYETNLLAHKPIDFQHNTRYLRSPMILAWLGNDTMSKDDIRLQAELGRLSYQHLPNSANGYIQSGSMLGDMNFVANRPGEGFTIGRGEGWITFAMAASYATSGENWRVQARPWFNRLTNLISDGQSQCAGNYQSLKNAHWWNSTHRGRQSIEQAILENAIYSVRNTVYGNLYPAYRARINTSLLRSTTGMISDPAWKGTGGSRGPWSVFAVAPVPLDVPYCNNVPSGGFLNGADHFQTWSSFAYGYELTGDTVFLDKALEMANGISSTNDLLQFLEASNYNNLENRAALFSLVETLP